MANSVGISKRLRKEFSGNAGLVVDIPGKLYHSEKFPHVKFEAILPSDKKIEFALQKWKVIVDVPVEIPVYGGMRVYAQMIIPASFPFKSPTLSMCKPFPRHPQVGTLGGINLCGYLHGGRWSPAIKLETIAVALANLFENPDCVDGIMDPEIASLLSRDPEAAKAKIQAEYEKVDGNYHVFKALTKHAGKS